MMTREVSGRSAQLMDAAEDLLINPYDGNFLAVCRQRGWDWREALDFSSNINPLGHPPGVSAAIDGAMEKIRLYPEDGSPDLTTALGQLWKIPAASILPGNGATDLLYFFARAAWQGPVALVTPCSPNHLRAFPKAMRVPLDQPERWPQRGLLVLTQPNQPTGEALPEELLRRVVESREGPVLVDESFIEFTPVESIVGRTQLSPHLVVLRSLTPFYGLPGLRVGALAAGEEWMGRLRRRREPGQVSALAEAAAIAAIADDDFAGRSHEFIAAEREWMRAQLHQFPDVEISNSVANYFFTTVSGNAADAVQWFLDRKILIRGYAGLPGIAGEAVGFSVRTRSENERFLQAAKERFCAGS
jgi:threonine-phosphate decarboxylase